MDAEGRASGKHSCNLDRSYVNEHARVQRKAPWQRHYQSPMLQKEPFEAGMIWSHRYLFGTFDQNSWFDSEYLSGRVSIPRT